MADEPQPGQLHTAITEPDGPLSRDDCLEVIVDATGERTTPDLQGPDLTLDTTSPAVA